MAATVVPKASRQLCKRFHRPMLGCTEGSAGIEADDFPSIMKAVGAPNRVRRGFIGWGSKELHSAIDLLATCRSGQIVVSIHDRAGNAAAPGVALPGRALRQQERTPMQRVADALAAIAKPG